MQNVIIEQLAEELGVRPQQVATTVELLDQGATVPFIARYRKEATGGLDDTQLRQLEERLVYLRELEDRRGAILVSIREQGKLTPDLQALIESAATKQRLEDLYLPYKPKRRTKAQMAREAGLEPLAIALLEDPRLDPETVALGYLNPEAGITDTKLALEGARQILMERFAEDAELLAGLRNHMQGHGHVRSSVVRGKEIEGAKYRDWFNFVEPLAQIPSHRALAMMRGRNEGMLSLALVLDSDLDEDSSQPRVNPCEQRIAQRFRIHDQGRPADRWLLETVRWAWRIKISMHLEVELMGALRDRAEEEAIRIFGRNLQDLLLAAPAGPHVTMGIDPGIRTGCKVAVVDATGKLLDTTTVYPHEPRRDWAGSLAALQALVVKHQVTLIAIGNGTASRETDALVTDLVKACPAARIQKIIVSEAGASVYSASELAAREFPDLDVSLRGAVSIARRLQDPLAELVKIDPQSIGVGQYQHDVSQFKLAKRLDAVVEDCVNAVGVDLNTASAPLLARISGLNSGLAMQIVSHRDRYGAFQSREDLKKVARLGDKTFEQAAGFLRIPNGSNPLDASSVHPEAYPLVERIIAKIKQPLSAVMGRSDVLRAIRPSDYLDDRFGLPTIQDILKELEKPGRDPRPEFRTAEFSETIRDIKDLKPDMVLEGVVTNVAAFGAFVDIGVHQDGLVHVSALAHRFVKDPHTVVKTGQVVRVRVIEVDLDRKRIALTMRLDDPPAERHLRNGNETRPRFTSDAPHVGRKSKAGLPAKEAPKVESAMAAAFAKL